MMNDIKNGGFVAVDKLVGLTKLEYFSAMAMQALIIKSKDDSDCPAEGVAIEAVAYAESLLIEVTPRNK